MTSFQDRFPDIAVRPEPAPRAPVDYVAWNKELKKHHAAITRAWNAGKYEEVVRRCVLAKRYFDTIIWPDNWAWYNIKFQDAQQKAGVHWNNLQHLEDVR